MRRVGGGFEHIVVAQFAVAASTLLLLFIGIHNAWDAVSYHVFVNLGGSRREAQNGESTRDETAGNHRSEQKTRS